jgi:hypothetical protein
MKPRILGRVLPVAALILLATPAAGAGVVKCKDAKGAITYTQNACPAGTSPLELDPGFSPAETSPSGPARPISATGTAVKGRMERCMSKPTEEACEGLERAAEVCRRRDEWQNPTCIAMKEAAEAISDQLTRRDENSRSLMRGACERGERHACVSAACAGNTLNDGSDAEVRYCAETRRLPNSSQWVQLESQSATSHSTLTYLCMKRLTRVNSLGITIRYRPRVTIIGKVPTGGISSRYHTILLPTESFATAAEAAVAACQTQVEASEKKQESYKDSAGI